MSDWTWWAAQGAAVVAIIGAFLQVLPVIAAVAGGVYYAIQIWETRTIQHWWNNKKMKAKAKRLARLRAQEKLIQAQIEATELLQQARSVARTKLAQAALEANQREKNDAAEIEERLTSSREP